MVMVHFKAGLAALTTVVFSILSSAASAQTVISTYTDVDLDTCTVVSADDFGATWACPGYKGIPVMIGEGDLRFFVSYGLTSTTERAAEQTLPPFNHLGPRIEWRIGNVGGQITPFATILRFFVARPDGEEGEGQVLVVTRLGPGATCHVAYIDASANPNANELARKAADETAQDFDCADEPDIIGAFAAW
jgi:hypothetical protein